MPSFNENLSKPSVVDLFIYCSEFLCFSANLQLLFRIFISSRFISCSITKFYDLRFLLFCRFQTLTKSKFITGVISITFTTLIFISCIFIAEKNIFLISFLWYFSHWYFFLHGVVNAIGSWEPKIIYCANISSYVISYNTNIKGFIL